MQLISEKTKEDALTGFNVKSSGVRLRGITKIFPTPDGNGETTAVNSIDLDVSNGELITLLGPSGCGKTTTLRMISGFEYPSAGSITIAGRDVAKIPPNKRGVAMVFQSYALFPHLSVWENVAYGLKVKRLPKEEILARTGKAIALMQLEGMETRFPSQLSGGQQQRVSLARAIVIEPSVLLFDEPLSNLDAKLREYMRDELRALQKRLGITSIYVTHDQSEAMAISDRVAIMKEGNIVQLGTPEEIYEYPNSNFIANFIGKANFIPGTFKGMQSDGAVIQAGDKKFIIPNPGDISGLKAGEACVLTLRPESADICADDNEQGILGRVLRVTYFGAKAEYEVKTDLAAITVEVFNPRRKAGFAEGSRVKVVIDLDSARILKKDSGLPN